MSLYVVYVRETGHVAGAVDAVGVPGPGNAAALVGAALPLRVSTGPGEIVSLPLPAADLEVHAADEEPDVFADPLAFGVEPAKPVLTRLREWGEEPTFSPDSLVITVPVADQSRATPVLALVTGGQDLRILSGEIPAGQDAVELAITVPAGTYGVLALVAGWAGALTAVRKS